VAISGDGWRVLSTAHDFTLRVWDVESGTIVRVLHGHSGYVMSAVFSQDDRLALSAAPDATVRLCDVESAEIVRVRKGHTDCVKTAAL